MIILWDNSLLLDKTLFWKGPNPFDRVVSLENAQADLYLRLAHISEGTFSHIVADITKTYLYKSDPLKPHFYIVKLGFTGVYIIFLISAQKHRLCVLVRTASNEYPQPMF